MSLGVSEQIVYVCVCVYIYIYTHTHTHTQYDNNYIYIRYSVYKCACPCMYTHTVRAMKKFTPNSFRVHNVDIEINAKSNILLER